MEEIKCTVIIPVYNVERVLERCVDSVLHQTEKNFELLLIDDGSTDKSGMICDKYVEKDSRVKVIHQKNSGVSSARNKGLQEAKGESIIFVDSDDYVTEKYLEHLLSSQSDFVIAGRNARNEDRIIKVFQEEDNAYDKITSNLLEYLFSGGKLNYCYSKCYKRKIIRDNNICFDEELKISEDTLFTVEYILCCMNVQLISKCDYQYIFYGTGTLSSKKISKDVINMIELANEKIEAKLVSRLGENGHKMTELRMALFYKSILFKLINCKENISYGLIKDIFQGRSFYTTLENVNELYKNEGKKFCNILKCNSPFVFWLFVRNIKRKSRKECKNEAGV